jgi:hypothetical protein
VFKIAKGGKRKIFAYLPLTKIYEQNLSIGRNCGAVSTHCCNKAGD